MWLITHLPPFFLISSSLCWMRKRRRRSRSGSRRMRAKEEVLGWEAYIAVVALFIYIIVQAGLWALERCFVCHSLQPWGYGGLAFPMINIQTDSHLEPRHALPGFGFLYIYIYLFYYLCIHFIFFFRSLLPLSMCFFLSACGIAIF